MSKELEAFQKIIKLLNEYHQRLLEQKNNLEAISTYPIEKIEKTLKVLDIIKEKEVDTEWLIFCIEERITTNKKPLELYNSSVKNELTEEEFELLKEVLL